MNRLSIALLVAGTAAVTGYVVSKVIKNKKNTSGSELFDDCDDCCCDSCSCDDDLDVIIPAEETEDCAEAVEDAAEVAEEAVEAVEDSVEEAIDGEADEEKAE